MQTAYRNILIGLVAGGALLSAGSVTIPNSFTAGNTAKPSEDNANFTAVKTAVNGNAADITTNAGNISTNTTDIATNKSNITTNTTDIATNKTAIADTASMWVRDHEGNIHPTVTIGSQVWMADNMYVTTYPDGAPIEDISTWNDGDDDSFAFPIKETSNYEGNANTPVASYGDIDIKRYGLFYQWNAAMAGSTTEGAQGICPSGWHIPTNADWDQLQSTLGSSTTADDTWNNGKAEKVGNKIKLGGGSGFSAVYSGHIDDGADRKLRGIQSAFWSSSLESSSPWYRVLAHDEEGVYRGDDVDKTYGTTIRCVKD
jgi:uncharacterized protein (TIGR02145 family)